MQLSDVQCLISLDYLLDVTNSLVVPSDRRAQMR